MSASAAQVWVVCDPLPGDRAFPEVSVVRSTGTARWKIHSRTRQDRELIKLFGSVGERDRVCLRLHVNHNGANREVKLTGRKGLIIVFQKTSSIPCM